MKIQEYYINGWIKNNGKTLKEIEDLGATIISVHITEKNEEGEIQGRFADIRKGNELWS